MTDPVEPGAVTVKAGVAYRSRRARWIADLAAAATDTVTIALHPPTERRVAADPDAAVVWVRAWQSRSGEAHPGTVEWNERRWRSYGTQQVPVRLTLTGADQVAHAAGKTREWRTLVARRATLTRLVTGTTTTAPGLPASLARSATRWLALDEADFALLADTLRWLRAHPSSGMYIRQLPIPGVDTKWVASHRGLLEELLRGLRGDGDLGVRTLPRTCEVAVCDRTLLPGAPAHFAAPLAELAELHLQPKRVLMLENKEGLYALPPLPGSIALHGGGYAVHELAELPWVRSAECWYWGDLDTHGFAILDRLRGHLPHVRSLLMDVGTVEAWSEFAVPEPKPVVHDTLPHLDPAERAAFERVRDRRLRLEQERIPWPHVLDRLELLADHE